ncbi:MAG: TrkH family potassium uptake protein [Clostridiales Family XIII bacterium]|jgi:trk system potassium uptake protein TrkH|nr:TrkH family potassium uptake protein [Clostridiales Family XIII bacterium]
MNLNLKLILKMTGVVTALSGLLMIPCIPIAAIYHEDEMLLHFVKTVAVFIIGGGLMYLLTKSDRRTLRRRDGFLVVTLCWVIISFVGALPYLFMDVSETPIDAFFESVSGFTTTGVTLIDALDELPKSLIFWRGIQHWFGGMGILIMAVSVLPALGIGASNLANAENSGRSAERFTGRIKESAKNIYIIYIIFTVIETVLLSLGNMNLFDAFYFTCGSMGNCILQYDIGFTKHYSPYNEIIITIFCILCATNFATYQLLIKKRVKEFFKNPEIKTYLIILISFSSIVTIALIANGTFSSVAENIRYGVIQTIMFVTTGGYGATDYNLWPEVTKWILILAMFIGGCSQSTAGGLKIVRVSILIQVLRRNIFRRIHPRAVVAVKLGGEAVSADKAQNTLAFFLVYISTFFFGCIILSIDGQNVGTTATAILATLSNTGLGFENVGFTGNWSVFSGPARLFLSLIMIMGRLEIFTILMLFSPTFWRPDR